MNGQGSTTLSAKVWQAGECFEDSDANSKFTFKWKKFSSSGVQDTAFAKTGASITVNASEISQKATFVCELFSK